MKMGENSSPNAQKCFNAPKNWQLGWFKDGHVNLDSDESTTVDLMGVVDYNSSLTSDLKLFVRVKGVDEDVYVSFNRQAGANKDTEEGGDQVLIHTRSNNEPLMSDSKSKLVSMLLPGDSTKIGNHIIELVRSREKDNIRQATVRITASSLSPTSKPSSVPSKSPQPSKLPSAYPTTSIHPSNSPTSYPSAIPSLEPSLSEAPSTTPSDKPSTRPSEIPSTTPSLSLNPSSMPSTNPTSQPSSQPSTEPSPKPSPDTQYPSSTPSGFPSNSTSPSQEPDTITANGPCDDNPRQITGIPGILLETSCKKFVNQYSEPEIAEMCLYTIRTGPRTKCPGVCNGNCRCRDNPFKKFQKKAKRMACQALARKKLRKRRLICKRVKAARDECPVSFFSLVPPPKNDQSASKFIFISQTTSSYLQYRIHVTIGVNFQGSK